jgi:carbamoyltransferase
MNILGLICFQGHASSAALIRNGELVAAAIEDRFTRRKQDTAFPANAIRYILDSQRLGISEIDEAAFAWDPRASLLHHLGRSALYLKNPWEYAFAERAGHGGLSRFDKFKRMCRVRRDFERHFQASPRIRYVPHHLAHSFSACIQVQREPALSVVADGIGDRSAVSVFAVDEGRHQKVAETPNPHSFGILYSALTQLLGLRPDKDEYKVMGLSAYGRPTRTESFRGLAAVKGARLRLDLGCFSIHRSASRFHTEKLLAALGAGPGASFQDKADIAKSLQDCLETNMVALIEQALAGLGRRPEVLCTSGGVFLNCLLNQRIREALGFREFHFSPIADDNGAPLGAAACSHHLRTGSMPRPYRGLDLGPSFSEEEMLAALARHPQARWERCAHPARAAAGLLSSGKVLAVHNGRTEFGPRALGFRSILADPRDPRMRDILCDRIKRREPFQPFAPSVLEERADEFFHMEGRRSMPFMIETVRVRREKSSLIPAVVHQDSTARVQTVSREADPAFHALIAEFDRLTGVPLVLNTSFNRKDEPMANSPDDALSCFVGTGIDALLLGPFLVRK